MQQRHERTEHVRAYAQQLAAAGGAPESLLQVTAGDPVAATTAWASFVPFLAHPVTAGTARAGMDVLEHTSHRHAPTPMVA